MTYSNNQENEIIKNQSRATYNQGATVQWKDQLLIQRNSMVIGGENSNNITQGCMSDINMKLSAKADNIPIKNDSNVFKSHVQSTIEISEISQSKSNVIKINNEREHDPIWTEAEIIKNYRKSYKYFMDNIYTGQTMNMINQIIVYLKNPTIQKQRNKIHLHKILIKMVKYFMLSPIEIVYFSLYLDIISFKASDKFQDYLYIVAYLVKINLNEDINHINQYIKIKNPYLLKTYEEFTKRIPTIRISPKESNRRFSLLTRHSNAYCKANVIDRNYIVDQIIDMSLPYSEHKSDLVDRRSPTRIISSSKSCDSLQRLKLKAPEILTKDNPFLEKINNTKMRIQGNNLLNLANKHNRNKIKFSNDTGVIEGLSDKNIKKSKLYIYTAKQLKQKSMKNVSRKESNYYITKDYLKDFDQASKQHISSDVSMINELTEQHSNSNIIISNIFDV